MGGGGAGDEWFLEEEYDEQGSAEDEMRHTASKVASLTEQDILAGAPPSPSSTARPGFGRKSSLDCISASLKASHLSQLSMSESSGDLTNGGERDTLALCVPLAHGVQIEFESSSRRRGSRSKNPGPLLLCSISIVIVLTLVLLENKAMFLSLLGGLEGGIETLGIWWR